METNQGTLTPLLGWHCLFGGLGTALWALFYDVSFRGYTAANDPAVADPIAQWASGGGIFCIVMLLLSGGLELAVRQGYDPPFLNTRFYGATVVGVRLPGIGETVGHLTLAPVNHPVRDYWAEMDEIKGISEGDLVVFGEHITRIRRLQASAPSKQDLAPIERSALKKATQHWKSVSRTTKDHLQAALLVPLGGYLIGANLLPLFFREDILRMGRRSRFSYRVQVVTGNDALLYNIPLVLAGLAIILFSFWAWRRGWSFGEEDPVI